mmetsp:Transcript_24860/g.41564  ORF Transcript_24860/g.41564 Transcript_24860/m.41564 type:complete len:237 (-) Transcript_24860:236-946(-)
MKLLSAFKTIILPSRRRCATSPRFASTLRASTLPASRMSSYSNTKCVIVPGNGGGGDIRGSNFYGWVETELKQCGFDVRLPKGGMPDPLNARESVWVPYMLETLECDENTILIGHSSGAAAAMRLVEEHKVLGLVLVAAYDDDMGDDLERKSGYFSRPWDWTKMQENAQFIVQFAGSEDTLVPIEVQRRVARALSPKAQFIEDIDGDHFFEPPFPELIQVVKDNVDALQKIGEMFD